MERTKKTRSRVVTAKRGHLLKALDEAAGCWKDKDHPELRGGATAWVAKLRREGEPRP